MAEKKAWQSSFRMKQLPKPEYRLMKAIIEEYQLDDPSELFIIGMRVLLDMRRFTMVDGEQWVQNVINQWRSESDSERSYEFPGL